MSKKCLKGLTEQHWNTELNWAASKQAQHHCDVQKLSKQQQEPS